MLKGGGGGGEEDPVVEVTVNSMKENSLDFCPNYVKEFDLSSVETITYRESTWEKNVFYAVWHGSCKHKNGVTIDLETDSMPTWYFMLPVLS